MAAEQVLKLLDTFWFETTIFTNKRTPSKFPLIGDSIVDSKRVELLPLDSNLMEIPTLEVRSFSDQSLGSKFSVFSDSSSPKSVFAPRKLKTIPSGKEIREIPAESGEIFHEEEEDIPTKKKQRHGHRRRRSIRKGRTTKSLTELEFMELKGFMDLGFVFCEEDKDSKLVSLIPGLQRLGREDAGEGEEEEQRKIDDETVISDQPYLSENWGVLDQREVRKPNPLLNWKVPSRVNETDMKHNLRFWAQTVASIVR